MPLDEHGLVTSKVRQSVTGDSSRAAALRSFTLIETILVIVIVAILIALMAPSLTRLKGRAYETTDLASLHQNSTILSVYANDWHESFPAFADPTASQTVLYYHQGKDFNVMPAYFVSFADWNYALADQYLGGDPFQPSLYAAEQVAREGAGGWPFLLSCVLFAKPEYWDLTKRTGKDQLGATSHRDLGFPSEKIVLYSGWAWRQWKPVEVSEGPSDPRIRVPLAKGDGSAAAVSAPTIERGVPSGDGPYDTSFHFYDQPPGAHTLGGLRGRDFR